MNDKLSNLKVNFIKIDTSAQKLVGYHEGKRIYEEQVKGNYEDYVQTTIIFPQEAKDISMSFIQGLFDESYHELGNERFYRRIKFMASDYIEKKIVEVIPLILV